MPNRARRGSWLHTIASDLVAGPTALALLPSLLLASFWAGGEPALVAAAIALPALVVLATTVGRYRMAGLGMPGPAETVLSRQSLEAAVDAALNGANRRGANPVCLMVALDIPGLPDDAGHARLVASAARDATRRLRRSLRREDTVIDLGHGRAGIVLSVPAAQDRGTLVQLAARIQSDLQTPVRRDGAEVRFAASIGAAGARHSDRPAAAELIARASGALDHARRAGPSTIRVHATAPPLAAPASHTATPGARTALERGEIRAWFQPQLCTHTGQVSGFEALARWCDPDRGVLLPGRFLPQLEAEDLLDPLQEIILREALGALRKWQARGHGIPGVGVNFPQVCLARCSLADRVAWELDRHDLAPGRLCIEVLETVVATDPNCATATTLRRLAELGCRIDLDDFGTGHAAITTLKTVPAHRIKIDRSFVLGVDRDADRQDMVTAILTMAGQLRLQTLAEGVETAGEHALLAQLGCDHVQGFGIARPMPFDATLGWLDAHAARLGQAPRIGGGTR